MSACFVFCCTITVLLMFSVEGESCSEGTLTDGAEDCCYGLVKIGNICKACPAGYFGKNCSNPCPLQLYGPDCTQICYCSYCHPVYGCDARNDTATQTFRTFEISTSISDELNDSKTKMDAMTQEPSKMMTINVPDEVKDLKRIIIISCGTLISVALLLLMIREIRRYTLL
uniref:Uncharacterized protein n=1 Tax=Magallana gigas TaxID=29159 RepID=A0A8W8LUA0_MAGGI|nr:tyrosine-protein kinase receptor Tie-2-like isoform X1 [Crassostrea gigas]